MARTELQDPGNLLAEKIFGPQKKDEIPYILCRRNFSHPMTYNQHDATWEGLRRVIRDGRVKFEIHHNFNLIIYAPNGYCKIPKTPSNEKRLDRIGKPTIRTETHRRIDHSTGQWTDEEVEVREPPMYERIEDSMIEDQMVDKLLEKMKDRLKKEQAGPDPDVPEMVEEVMEPEPEVPQNPGLPTVTKKRGRPKKIAV